MTKILIVDDEAHTAAVMSLWLSQHGHDTLVARDGREALETLEAGPVDLIVSDVNMPRLDGVQFAKEVRSKQGLKIPLLMLTSRCDQSELAKEMAKYDVGLLPKPFMPSRLIAEIERLLSAVAT